MRIKITDYEKMKDRIDELEKELLLRGSQEPQKKDHSFEMEEMREEITYKDELISNRDKEI